MNAAAKARVLAPGRKARSGKGAPVNLDRFLQQHGITAARHEHPAVMTVEESERLVPQSAGRQDQEPVPARPQGHSGISW